MNSKRQKRIFRLFEHKNCFNFKNIPTLCGDHTFEEKSKIEFFTVVEFSMENIFFFRKILSKNKLSFILMLSCSTQAVEQKTEKTSLQTQKIIFYENIHHSFVINFRLNGTINVIFQHWWGEIPSIFGFSFHETSIFCLFIFLLSIFLSPLTLSTSALQRLFNDWNHCWVDDANYPLLSCCGKNVVQWSEQNGFPSRVPTLAHRSLNNITIGRLSR